jgi:hypothetical protein
MVVLFSFFQNVNPNSRTTSSPSHDLNSLRPINYSSPQRQSISAQSGSKQYPYDSHHLSPTSSPPSSNKLQPVTSTPNRSPQNSLNIKMSMIQQQQQQQAAEPITGDISERGRERKKTTIFGTLRKRLSRSKTRNGENNNNNNGTGMSTTTNGFGESHHHAISPTSIASSGKDTTLSLKSPTGTLSKFGISGSRRSSISEMSGLSRMSSASNKTFVHEASSLVLEVIENGVKR